MLLNPNKMLLNLANCVVFLLLSRFSNRKLKKCKISSSTVVVAENGKCYFGDCAQFIIHNLFKTNKSRFIYENLVFLSWYNGIKVLKKKKGFYDELR